MKQYRVLRIVATLAVAIAANTSADAQPTEGGRHLSWQSTETSLALMNGDQMVWKHVHDRTVGKPFMRFGLMDGVELTRPWPFPDDYPRNDHVWHRALWWSWKTINGVNFWEQHQEGTEPVEVKITRSDDYSASIVLTIQYHEPGQPPVIEETRTISISQPDADGGYFIDWTAVFDSADGNPVVFGQNSYGGLAIRFTADCCGDSQSSRPAWVFHDDQGRENQTNNQRARWVAYSGQVPEGGSACVAIFDHPENPRHPAYWQLRNQYPYLNPSLTCKEDFELAADQELTLRYRILIAPRALTSDALQQQWKTFAAATHSS